MFTFDTLVDSYTKGLKQLNSFVTHAEFRKNLDALADRQAEFAKGVAQHVQAGSDFVVKSVKDAVKFDSTKTK